MEFLIVIEPASGGRYEHRVGPGSYVLGREEASCDIAILSPEVSRQHARIHLSAEQCNVEDLGSTAGTSKDGQALEDKQSFPFPGEVMLGTTKLTVSVADVVEMTFDSGSVGSPTASPSSAISFNQGQPASPKPSAEVGHFTKGREIARGGMGAILQANDRMLGRTVAMKVVLEERASEDARMRFIREATVLGRLEHPNIVPIHELGKDDDSNFFYAMKMVEGRTLQAIINDLKKGDRKTVDEFHLDRLLTVFRKVCDAIAFAHSKGIVHRDLKPENVMVGAFGEVLVMDWGLAKILNDTAQTTDELEQQHRLRQESAANVSESAMPNGFQELSDSQLHGGSQDLTMDGAVMGSPQYMPPEQAEGRIADIDEKSDIYSLGGILYAILTLRPPIRGKTVVQVLQNVKTGNILDPTEHNPGGSVAKEDAPKATDPTTASASLPHCPDHRVPAALSAVAMKAMALQSMSRYLSVPKLLEEIEKFQSGFATSAENISVLGQLALFIKRNKAVSIAAAISVLLIAGITVGFLFKVNAEKEFALEQEGKANKEKLAALKSEQDAQSAKKEAIKSEVAAKLALADAAYGASDMVTMNNVLDSIAPEMRNQEWRYLSDRSQNYLHKLPSPQEGVHISAATASDAYPGLFAIGARMGGIWLIDGYRGEILKAYSIPIGKDAIRHMKFSPDGLKLYSMSPGRLVHEIDLRTSKIRILLDRTDKKIPYLKDFDISPDGRTILIKGPDLRKEFISISSGKVLGVIPAQGESMFLNTDADVFTYGGRNYWKRNRRSSERTWSRIRVPGSTIFYAMDASMDRRKVHLADGLGDLRTIDASNGETLLTIATGLTKGPRVFCSARDAALVVFGLNATGDYEGKVVSQNRGLLQMNLHGLDASDGGIAALAQATTSAGGVAYSPDSGLLLAAARRIAIWSVPAGKEKANFSNRTTGFAFSKNHRIWRFGTKEAMELSPDKDRHLNMALFDRASGMMVDDWFVLGQREVDVETCRSGSRSVVGNPIKNHWTTKVNPLIAFNGVGDGLKKVEIKVPTPLVHGGSSFDFTENGESFLVNLQNGTTQIHESDTGSLIAKIEHPDRNNALAGAFHSSDQRLVTVHDIAGSTNQMRSRLSSWDLKGTLVSERRFGFTIEGMDVSPDGRLLALGCSDKKIRIMKTAQLEKSQDGSPKAVFEHEFRAHDQAVGCLEFHSTGKYLISGSSDQRVKVWNVDDDYSLNQMRLALGNVHAVHFNPEETQYGASVDNARILVWDFQPNQDQDSAVLDFMQKIDIEPQ